MKFDNVAVLRENLEQMETQQLDEMLHMQLRKDQPDGQLIRMIGSVLRERERDRQPEITPEIQKAWERYQKLTQPPTRKPKSMRSTLVKAASIILVLLILAALLPREAEAESFFDRFIAWTSDVFSLLSPVEKGKQQDIYEFRTDNPGLQEVYDKVTELGVTIPVVPSWFLDGYVLKSCKITETPTKTYMSVVFTNGELDAVYELNVYNGNLTSAYTKDENIVRILEMNNIEHTLMHNKDLLLAVWEIENIECAINIDCEEDELNRILKSIYTMEEN
ncbi:MAG: DUF4367 domain-containing protein [Oscillospiraceae bacterium]|nr:DUF4367 domain-containing protein [Oscillospiraceae bacterium]